MERPPAVVEAVGRQLLDHFRRSPELSIASGDLPVGGPAVSGGHPFGTRRADGGPAVGLGIVSQVRRGAPEAFIIGDMPFLSYQVDLAEARRITERMALLLQASLLLRHGPEETAEAFCASRLDGAYGLAYGTLPAGLALDPILERAMPAA